MTGRQSVFLAVQILRRLVQACAVLLIVFVAFLSLYAHYRAANALDDTQFLRGPRGKILLVMDRQLGKRGHRDAWPDAFQGTLWSMRFFGWSLSDPLALAEMSAASRSFYVPLAVSCVIPMLLALLLGRVFCSWICPAGLLFEMTGKIRKLLGFAEIRPAEVRFSHRNKYYFVLTGLMFSFLLGRPIFSLIYPPAMFSRIVHAWVFGASITGMLGFLLAMVVFEIAVSPRWWCRSMCPGGALYGLLGKYRPLKVRLEASRCTGCRKCLPVCEEGINPIRESSGMECDNCLVCLWHCPDDALTLSVGLSGAKRHAGQSMPARKTGSIAAKTAIWMVVLCAWLGSVHGHHILGLPHYAYKENYPQAPVLEYPATAGPYDILLTSYPGIPVPGERANLAFYIKRRGSDATYEKDIVVRVLHKRAFGRHEVVLRPNSVRAFDKLHKIAVDFPYAGEYFIEMTMDVEGRAETILFVMTAGNPSSPWPFLIGVSFCLFALVVTIRAVKIKKARRALRLAHGARPAG